MNHSAFAGCIGVAREDITPPVGIYCRNWGAATHDAAEGIHLPLTLSALTLQQHRNDQPLVFLDADLGWWVHLPFARRFIDRLLEALKLEPSRLVLGFSHTHSAPPLCDPEPQWHGGELLPAFVEKVLTAAVSAANRARAHAVPALLEWHAGRCNLAANRDLRNGNRIVCGYNPQAAADDTLLLGRVSDISGKTIATITNYACHPTTLAWQNQLISPDYLGAFRATMQRHTGAPALFMQGASGELAPRRQYTGDTSVADAHGRHLAFAALATLEDMPPPGNELAFDRVVESGAPLAIWKWQPRKPSNDLRALVRTANLPLKNWPRAEELQRHYQAATDRPLKERLRRQLRIRESLGDGNSYPLPVWGWRLGNALLLGSLVEAYSAIQTDLRREFADHTLLWLNLINGSIGYLPPAPLYHEHLYQVWQTPFERGGLEALTDASKNLARELMQ